MMQLLIWSLFTLFEDIQIIYFNFYFSFSFGKFKWLENWMRMTINKRLEMNFTLHNYYRVKCVSFQGGWVTRNQSMKTKMRGASSAIIILSAMIGQNFKLRKSINKSIKQISHQKRRLHHKFYIQWQTRWPYKTDCYLWFFPKCSFVNGFLKMVFKDF